MTKQRPTRFAALAADTLMSLLLGFTTPLLGGCGSCLELRLTFADGGWWLSSPEDLVTQSCGRFPRM